MLSTISLEKVLTVAAILLGSALVGYVFYEAQTPALADDLVTIQRFESGERNIYGSSRAPITIVEFSDYECPFCARLHPDLKRIVDESDGNVAWEYRHLPLRIHPLAVPAAVAAECIDKHEGATAFWSFTDRVFTDQSKLTPEHIKASALELGLSEEQLKRCEADPAIAKLIMTDSEAARSLGGTGTPFNVIVYPDNTYKVVSGAVPYEQWQPYLRLNYE